MVMISGNLTKAPTLRKTSAGTSVANFYVASNRKFKDKSGFWKEDVCYVGVVAWHQLADSCENFLKKGSAILIEGELQSRSWEGEDGAYRSIVEVKWRDRNRRTVRRGSSRKSTRYGELTWQLQQRKEHAVLQKTVLYTLILEK